MAIKFLSGQTISGTLTVSGNVQGATFNGLAINTTGVNNLANQIVRTEANGYVNFGWINSVSGNHTGTITRITASGDAYLRYVTPAQFRTGVTDGYYAPVSTVSGVTSVATGNGLTGGTIISTGTLSMSGSYTGNYTNNGLLTVNYTGDAQIMLTSPSTWCGIGFNDSQSVDEYLWYNGAYGTFALGGGGSSVVNKRLHVDGGMTIGANYDATAVSSNSLKVEGSITSAGIIYASGGNSNTWNSHTSNTGTVTSVATGNGLSGGTITTSGTLTMSGSYTGKFSATGLNSQNQRGNSGQVPQGHYSSGETVWEMDNTWSSEQLANYFNHSVSNVYWTQVADAPGGNCIYINGGVSVGGVYGSGFPYLPVETNSQQQADYYMEVWIQNVGTNQTHYMGSNEFNESFGSLGGNPGSYGYWVMANSNPGTGWTKYSAYIGGFSSSTIGMFELGTKYWTPMALLNYGAGSGTRACRISGWKVIKVQRAAKINMSGNDIIKIGDLIGEVGLDIKVDNGTTNAITIDNVGSTTFSGYTYFPNYLFHAGDTNTRIQFTTGVVTIRGDSGITLDGPTTTNANFTGTTATFSGLVSGITPTAAANFATKAYVDAHPGDNTSWPNVGAGTRTNYTLNFQPPTANYAGFQFLTSAGAGAGYLLIRGASNAGQVYKAEGISLISDASWVTIASRTTTNAGVRLMSGSTSAERLVIKDNGESYFTGNLGIGVTTLTGNGGLMVTNTEGTFANANQKRVASFYDGSVNANNPGIVLGYDDSSTPHGIVAARTQTGSGTIPGLQFFTYDGGWGPRMTILNTGNVGIGTTAPRGKLQINGNGNSWNESPSIRLWDTTNSKGWLIGNVNNYTAGDFYIRTMPSISGDPGSAQQEFTIKHATGNVGIGVIGPLSKLQIIANQSAASPGAKNYTGSAINTDGGDIATGRVFFQGSSSGATDMCGINNETSRIVLFNYTDSRYLQYWDHAGSSFIPNGNLSIGTTVNGGLSEKLFVDGAVRQQSAVGLNTNGSIRTGLGAYDNTTGWGAGIGGQLVLGYIYTGSSYTEGALIKMYKENSSQGHYGSGLRWSVRQNGTNLTAKMQLSPSGTLTVIEDIIAYGSPSDKKLKENIKPIESALDKVKKLQGVTFDWKESDSMLDIKEDIGFIAQDVQKVIPELVRENSNGLLSMRHQGIAPILLEAIKEQQKQIDDLKLQIKNFK